MAEKINLLLIVCILCQVIGTISGENNEKSSDILIRNKRVINPQEDHPVTILNFPYVVNIKKNNENHCVGSILSHHTVITVPSCVELNIEVYKVFSGSDLSTGGTQRSVIGKKIRHANHPNRIKDGVALITVSPPYIYSITSRNIELHNEPLLPTTMATIIGWGFKCGNQLGTAHPTRLRAITVPTIYHRECVYAYRNIMQILDSDICTYHAFKHCGHTDAGAPLVVNNKLVGVHLYSGQIVDINKPDVFVLLHPNYLRWIVNNIQ